MAPDNGLLSGVIAGYLKSPPATPGLLTLPSDITAVHLTNPDYWRHPVSKTFHGRDAFTPTAAHLSLGVPPESMGEATDTLYYQHLPQPERLEGKITGQVVYIDVYGNLVTNIPAEVLPAANLIEVWIKGRSILGLHSTFNDGPPEGDGGLIALTGSHGYLEVAVRNGNAATLLGAGDGEPVEVVTSSG